MFIFATVMAFSSGCTIGPAAPAAPELTAEQVVQQLAQRIPTIKVTAIYTADTDPNELLGRPGGYTSKANFADSRVSLEAINELMPPDDMERGGTVEVFATDDNVKSREGYLAGLVESGSRGWGRTSGGRAPYCCGDLLAYPRTGRRV